jgi:predicted dehydrogenase
MKTLNVGIVGYKFMGKAHSNAWMKAPLFFDLPAAPVRKVACGRHEAPLKEFAAHWGWEEIETDWKKMVARKDIDIVDISAPQNMHHEIALGAIANGKHVFSEKPMAMSYKQAREMYEAAEKAGVKHYINHNYRRCPAVMLAKKLIDEGKIGRIYHFLGEYLQSWIMDPNFPLTWHLRKETAAYGPHIDLGSHTIDLARFLVGEITSITGMTRQFITERPLPDEVAAGTFKAAGAAGGGKGKVGVEDGAMMTVGFDNGAIGCINTSRFAGGRFNYLHFEIYGEKGSLAWDFERMNELKYMSKEDPADTQGFRTIVVTDPVHPYVAAWWPPGHIIGYEHEFVHATADFVKAIVEDTKPWPNFYDGMKGMQIIEAGIESADKGKRIDIK